MKSTVMQIYILVSAAVILGLGYNAFSCKPLPWIREPRKVEYIPDSMFNLPASETQTLTSSPSTPESSSTQQQKKIPESQSGQTQSSQQKQVDKVKEQKPNEQAGESDLQSLAISYEQVLKLLNRPDVQFIDARNAEEYGEGHIGSAINIYAPDMEKHIPEIMRIPRSKIIVVYCGGGACELSHELADQLKPFNFKRVFVYVGGWTEWQKMHGK